MVKHKATKGNFRRSSSSFEKGALLAANLGDDADTTAAVYGQLAGAFHGAEAIPAGWLKKLAMREFIEQMADNLLALSENLAPLRKEG